MKVKDGLILRYVDGVAVVVAVGETSRTFHGMIRLNASGVILWETLAGGVQSADALTDALCAHYAVSRETAAADVAAFLSALADAGLLEES